MSTAENFNTQSIMDENMIRSARNVAYLSCSGHFAKHWWGSSSYQRASWGKSGRVGGESPPPGKNGILLAPCMCTPLVSIVTIKSNNYVGTDPAESSVRIESVKKSGSLRSEMQKLLFDERIADRSQLYTEHIMQQTTAAHTSRTAESRTAS